MKEEKYIKKYIGEAKSVHKQIWEVIERYKESQKGGLSLETRMANSFNIPPNSTTFPPPKIS